MIVDHTFFLSSFAFRLALSSASLLVFSFVAPLAVCWPRQSLWEGVQRLNWYSSRLATFTTLSSAPPPRCCWTIWDNKRLSKSCCFSSNRCTNMSSRSTSDIWRSLDKYQRHEVPEVDYVLLPVTLIFVFPFKRIRIRFFIFSPSIMFWIPCHQVAFRQLFPGICRFRFTYSSLRRLLDLDEWGFLRFFSPAPASSRISSSRSDIL